MTVNPKDALTHFHIEFETPPTSSPDDTVRAEVWGDEALDGQIQEYTPPVLNYRIIDWPTHTDGVQLVDGGLEEMQATITSLRYSGEFYRLQGATVKVICYNALRTGFGAVQKLRHELTGPVITVDGGTVTTGTTAAALTLTLQVDKFKVIQNTIGATGTEGTEIVLVDIDVNNRVRKIGSVDQLANIKTALGITSGTTTTTT